MIQKKNVAFNQVKNSVLFTFVIQMIAIFLELKEKLLVVIIFDMVVDM